MQPLKGSTKAGDKTHNKKAKNQKKQILKNKKQKTALFMQAKKF